MPNLNPKVIAEIGINHNGDFKKLIDLIETASICGADFIKLQKRDIDSCYTREELEKPCESPWGKTVEDKVRGRELSWDDFFEVDKICRRLRVGWGCSCFDLKSLQELNDMFGKSISFHKVPSAMSIHKSFLKKVSGFGKMTLISTGLCKSSEQIQEALDIFEGDETPYIANVVTAVYPCPIDRLDLNRIQTFTSEFLPKKWCQGIGYSGHEVGILPSIIAAFMGVAFIERHFTLDRSWYGADQAASLEPDGLKRLCRDVKNICLMRGSYRHHLVGDEKNPVPNFEG